MPTISSFLNKLIELWRSLYFIQSINLGLRDSLNPYGLSAILIFVYLLFLIKKDKLPLNIFCFFFIAGYIFSVFLLFFGIFDVLLRNLILSKAIQIANLILGLFFVWVGYKHLNGWWRLKKNNAFNQLVVKTLLFFNEETIKGRQLNWFRRNSFKIGSFCWGVWTCLLGSAWPADKDLYIMFGYLVEGHNMAKGIIGIGFFSLAQAWILFLVWILFLYIRNSDSSKLWVERYIALIKISGSALFLSVGIGITFLSFY